MKNKIVTVIVSALPLLSFALFRFLGQGGGGGVGTGGYGTSPVSNLDDVLRIMNTIITWGQAFLFVVAALMTLYAAWLFLTGGEAGAKTARQVLVWVAVGVGVAVLAYAITPVVCNLLGTTCNFR